MLLQALTYLRLPWCNRRCPLPHPLSFPCSIADNKICNSSSASSLHTNSNLVWKNGSGVGRLFHCFVLIPLLFLCGWWVCLSIVSELLPTMCITASSVSAWMTLSNTISVSITQSGVAGTPLNSGLPNSTKLEQLTIKMSLPVMMKNLPPCLSALQVIKASSLSLNSSSVSASTDAPTASSHEYGLRESPLLRGRGRRTLRRRAPI